MQPVSAGLRAGDCAGVMPEMQAIALVHALKDRKVAKAIEGRTLVLCIACCTPPFFGSGDQDI